MKHIYYNGQVYTGSLPLAEAFVEENGRFTFAGDSSSALAMASGEDTITDLKGNFVCPGFNDSHMHLLNYGNILSIAPLARHTGSLKDMLDCLRNFLKEQAPEENGWLMGRGWNQDYFCDCQRMPNRWDLDQVTTSFPICATRACGHCLVVNSRALELLGIDGHTAQPEGGRIGMENGEPDGRFFDNAMDLVYNAIPTPSMSAVKNMLRSACRALNAYGVTSAQSDDYCVFRSIPWQQINKAYAELEVAGELSVRVYEQANFTTVSELEEYIASGHSTGSGSELFRFGPLKMLGDGALGARTAFLSRPYADDPATRGLPVFSQPLLEDMILCAHKNGLQICVHAIGDACLDWVLGAYEKALKAYPRTDHRHGIVHCQITRPDQLKKIQELELHVYAQSIFLDYDINIVEARVGKELAGSSYSWKTLLDGGVSVSNGSDCPVEWPDCLASIQCAVTRKTLHGTGPYLPKEAFTVQEALDSYTIRSAEASFEENSKGRIQPGMLADFVILGQNPFETDVNRIKDIPVLATFLGGKLVYQK